MRLINSCDCMRLHSRLGPFPQQVRLIVVLACLLGHLALFQLVDASTQSSPSMGPALSVPLGNGNDNGEKATQKGGTPSRGQAVIESVPKEAREMFILYHLTKAINSANTSEISLLPRRQTEVQTLLKNSSKLKDIPTYDTFSTDLLEWTMRTFGWSQLDVSVQRRCRVICYRGRCFNVSDIGSLCCPF